MVKESIVTRCQGLDILKSLCAFMVICIHMPFPGIIGRYIIAISRMAVPVFLMITGFFYRETIEKNQEKKQILKILKMILFSSILYFVWEFAIGCAKFIVAGNPASITAVFALFSLDNILKMILFNVSPFASHLWYFNALVYVLVIAYLFRKVNLFKLLYWITPVLLCMDLVFGKYAVAIFGRAFDPIYVRNFLCVGIPYFMLGNAIRHILENNKFTDCLRTKKYLLILGVIVSAVLCVVEKYIVLLLDIDAVRDHYIFTTLLACLVFVLFVTSFENINEKTNVLSIIGRKYSASIYIIHPVIISVLAVISKILHIEVFYSYIAPVVVFVVTALVAVIYHKLKYKFIK